MSDAHSTIAGRLAAIKRLDDFAAGAGVVCSTSHEGRDVYVHMRHRSGLQVQFTLHPKRNAAIVVSWFVDPGFKPRLNTRVFTGVNPYRGQKATNVDYSLSEAIDTLRMFFAAADDGSAFTDPQEPQ